MKNAGAGLLIFREDGRVFLTLRSQEVTEPGVWAIPGGGLEEGETPWEGAVREAHEEVGFLPPIWGDTDVSYVHQSGRFSYSTFLVFMSDPDADAWEPELNWESDDWGWFELDALPDPLHTNVGDALDSL